MATKHLKIKVKGKVQGVSYRAATKAVADQLGVKGFITNEADGSVYIEVEGNAVMVASFVEWCREGPDMARVEQVEITEGETKNYSNFEVVKKNLLR